MLVASDDLAHRGARREDHQVGGVQAAQLLVEVDQAGGEAREAAVAVVGLRRHGRRRRAARRRSVRSPVDARRSRPACRAAARPPRSGRGAVSLGVADRGAGRRCRRRCGSGRGAAPGRRSRGRSRRRWRPAGRGRPGRRGSARRPVPRTPRRARTARPAGSARPAGRVRIWLSIAANRRPWNGSKKCRACRQSPIRSIGAVVVEQRAQQRLLGLDVGGARERGARSLEAGRQVEGRNERHGHRDSLTLRPAGMRSDCRSTAESAGLWKALPPRQTETAGERWVRRPRMSGRSIGESAGLLSFVAVRRVRAGAAFEHVGHGLGVAPRGLPRTAR